MLRMEYCRSGLWTADWGSQLQHSALDSFMVVVLTRLLAQCLRHCIFCLRGAYVDSPYTIGLRQLTRLRVLLTQASYDTTPSTHIKGGFGRCSVVTPRCSKVHHSVEGLHQTRSWNLTAWPLGAPKSGIYPKSTFPKKCFEHAA